MTTYVLSNGRRDIVNIDLLDFSFELSGPLKEACEILNKHLTGGEEDNVPADKLVSDMVDRSMEVV